MEILQFWIREALSNLWRNRFMSALAISTVTLSLFVLGALAISLANLRSVVGTQANQLELTVLLDKDTTPQRRNQIFRAVHSMPQVKGVKWVPASEVLQSYGREYDVDVADWQANNPVRDELLLQLNDPNEFFAVRKYLSTVAGIELLENQNIEAATQKLLGINRFLSVTASIALGVLGLAILLIINNSIRLTLYMRRREVRLMQLVGATVGYVRAPFLLEGMLYGIVGAIVASSALLLTYSAVRGAQMAVIQDLLPLSPTQVLAPCLLGLLLAGCLFGLLGSWLSFRQSRERIAE